jgi:phosphoglycerol transferase
VHAVQVIWLVLYSAVGGLNGVLGQLGLTAFRCTNRNSIFILALVLLFAVRALSRATRRWHSLAVLAAAALTIPVILWDQLPPKQTDEAIERVAASVKADRLFTSGMEKALPPGAMVFQLPVMLFPEAWPIHEMGDYEHLRPYLHSKSLRFSYGSNKGRSDTAWQTEAEQKPPAELARLLEMAGFAAIYINRKGYADNGAALIGGLQAAGYNTIIESPAHDLACVLLKPSATPTLPARPPEFSKGWYGPEGDPKSESWQCSKGDAEILLHNESEQVQTVQVSFQLSSHSPRTVRLEADGVFIYESPVLSPQKLSHFFSLKLKPGATKLSFATAPPVTFPGNPDTRAIGFMLHNFRVTPE